MSNPNNDVSQTININVPTKSGEENKLESTNKVIKIAKLAFKDISNASYYKIIKVFITFIFAIIVCSGGLLLYNFSKNPKSTLKIAEAIERRLNKDEEEDLKIRDDVSSKIRDELRRIVYDANADRACIFGLHNGKKNTLLLPWKYADMTYEEVNNNNKEIRYISQGFQDIQLGNYDLPYYIEKHGYFIGTVEDVRKIDPKVAQFMDETGGKIIAATILRSNGVDIGFEAVFWDSSIPRDSKADCLQKLTEQAKILSALFDLNIQKKKYEANNN